MYDIAAHGFHCLGIPMLLSEPGSGYGDDDSAPPGAKKPAKRRPYQRHPGDRARETMTRMHYAVRTIDAYIGWMVRFWDFHHRQEPAELGAEHVIAFLNYLAVQRKVSASTQNQALAALLFLYRHVLELDLPWFDTLERAKRPKRLPVVMTRDEVDAVLDRLHGVVLLMANLFYGAGLRLTACCRLRVMDIDFETNQITVRRGKGGVDRVTILPKSVKRELRAHLDAMQTQHLRDIAEGAGWVELPDAYASKSPRAGREWRWQWVFPATRTYLHEPTGQRRRHHLHQTTIQRAMGRAVREAAITKQAGCHTLRHSFATHLLEDGVNPRIIQKLMGHKNLATTMIYMHVTDKTFSGVRSPLDRKRRPGGSRREVVDGEDDDDV